MSYPAVRFGFARGGGPRARRRSARLSRSRWRGRPGRWRGPERLSGAERRCPCPSSTPALPALSPLRGPAPRRSGAAGIGRPAGKRATGRADRGSGRRAGVPSADTCGDSAARERPFRPSRRPPLGRPCARKAARAGRSFAAAAGPFPTARSRRPRVPRPSPRRKPSPQPPPAPVGPGGPRGPPPGGRGPTAGAVDPSRGARVAAGRRPPLRPASSGRRPGGRFGARLPSPPRVAGELPHPRAWGGHRVREVWMAMACWAGRRRSSPSATPPATPAPARRGPLRTAAARVMWRSGRSFPGAGRCAVWERRQRGRERPGRSPEQSVPLRSAATTAACWCVPPRPGACAMSCGNRRADRRPSGIMAGICGQLEGCGQRRHSCEWVGPSPEAPYTPQPTRA